MGLFDTVYSSYDLGAEMTGVELQTKAFDSFMGYFWIDPKGRLFEVSHDGTHNLEDDPDRHFFPYKWVPNGKHGKVIPYDHYTGDVRLTKADPVDGLMEIRVTFLKGEVYWVHAFRRFDADYALAIPSTAE